MRQNHATGSPPLLPPAIDIFSGREYLFAINHSAAPDEIVEDILLLVEHARRVPRFAELATSTQTGQRERAALLAPKRVVDEGGVRLRLKYRNP